MSKIRVYELAHRLGVESRVVLSLLRELGEFVRSASSTLEEPAVHRLERLLAERGSPRPLVALPPPRAQQLPRTPPPTHSAPARPVRPPKTGWDGVTPAQLEAARLFGGDPQQYKPRMNPSRRSRLPASGDPDYSPAWAWALIELTQMRLWRAAGVTEATLASQCERAGLGPEDMPVRVDGRRLITRLQAGESPAVAASRLREQRRGGRTQQKGA